jgi:hypothetical protein
LNLGVAGAAAAGAAALHSWPLAALGGVAYAALVAWDVVRGGPAKRGPVTPKLRPSRGYQDPGVREAVENLETAQKQLQRVLVETPDDVKSHLSSVLAASEELATRAAGLAERAELLSRYLATENVPLVARDLQDLVDRAARAQDPEVKRNYEAARASREEHLKVLGDLTSARERTIASLLSVALTLEALPAKVVRMRTLDEQAMDRLTGDVQSELERMNGDVRALEETLHELGEVAT